MGKKKHLCSEFKNAKKPKTEPVSGCKGLKHDPTSCASITPPLPANRLAALDAILSSIQAQQEEWPKELFKAVRKRCARMTRGGWAKAKDYFNMKFATSISKVELARKAREGIRADERVPGAGDHPPRHSQMLKKSDGRGEENSQGEEKLYSKLKTMFLAKIKKLQEAGVEEVPRTRKIPSGKIDHQTMLLLNRAVGEYAKAHIPSTMTDIARILQTAQACYQEATTKCRVLSPWKKSIEDKISTLSKSKEMIEKKGGPSKMTIGETKAARKVMRQLNLVLDKPRDRNEAVVKLNESIRVYEKKLEMHEQRKEFRRQNQCFELHRRKFYRGISEGPAPVHDVESREIREYWSTMWNKTPSEPHNGAFNQYLLEYLPEIEASHTFPTMKELEEIIKCLPCWKAAGVDGIYNFFIKRMTTLHPHLYEVIKNICLEGTAQDVWFYRGTTYLIPKGTPSTGSDFRPITCMSNLYKLTTKCVTEVMQLAVERRGLLTENQLGTVRRVQGAKEQAMLNIALNKEHGNNLKAAWIDVKKAFDSVDHVYLIKCIEKLNLPSWTLKFLEGIISRWELEIRAGPEVIMNKKVERGILQGDSLSPLLFVLCMDPLSRKLNEKYPKVAIQCGETSHATNHLLFIDDLKLLATDGMTLESMVEETNMFFNTIGLEINRDKSATNESACKDTATLLESTGVYKYLGIIEDTTSRPVRESFDKVKKELLARVERLCATKLNAKNLFKAINEHAISLVNYHIGLQHLEPTDFVSLDHLVRQILIKHKVHLQPGCKERLYLPRTEMGRGLHNVEMMSEHMLLQLKGTLEHHKSRSNRRAAILKVEEDNKTHLSLIEPYLMSKYGLGSVSRENLENAQKERLYSEVKKKTYHEKLYRARTNAMVSVLDSSTWLKHGNISPRHEANYCYIQDRNVFWRAESQCQHCGSAKRSVDHLATRCDRILGHDYARRHNEVVRCLHLLLSNKYGFRRSKRIRNHSVQEVMENENAEIRVDTRIKTDLKIANNRPDIFIYDKKAREVILVEVGITSQDSLQKVESEKVRKYDILAKELGLMYKCRSRIIPYVMTWDGVVTNYHKKHMKELGVTPTIEAYVQSQVLKRTLETISLEHRRGLEDGLDIEVAVQRAVERLCDSSAELGHAID